MQKTNFKTRLLALLTAAFMLVMCVPFAAFAEDVSPSPSIGMLQMARLCIPLLRMVTLRHLTRVTAIAGKIT